MRQDFLEDADAAPVSSGPFGLVPLAADPLLERHSPLGVSRGEAIGAAFREGAATTPTAFLGRAFDRAAGALGRAADPASDPYLTPDQANEMYGLEGRLEFDRPVPESRAAELFRIKRAEAEREALIGRSEAGLPELLAGGLAGSILDPIGAAASILPAGALARATPGLRSLGASSELSARVGAGIYEGMAIGAAFEGVAFPLATSQEQRNYTVADSLLNIVVSGGFGGVGGVFRSADIAAAPPSVRQAAVEGAIADVAADSPVSQPASVVDAWRTVRAAALDEQAMEGARIDARPIRSDEAVLPSGRRVPVEYAIVDVRALIASHQDDFMRDRRYPEALQPRDRTRADMQLQVDEIARALDPVRLGETFDAAQGAPIISARGEVESGNGRTMALRRAYGAGSATAYRDWLSSQGYPVEGVEQPVLVRVRQGEMTGEERLRFVREANDRGTSAMSAGEQAMADAAAVDPALFDAYTGGDAGLVRNAQFQRGFVDRIASRFDRNALVSQDGTLSPFGLRRMNDAITAYAYDDLDFVMRMVEGGDEGMRTIGNALREAAPEMAALRAKIRAGEIPADAAPAPDIVQAVAAARVGRRLGSLDLVLNQTGLDMGDAFGGVIRPGAEAILRMMYHDATMKRPRSQGQIAEMISGIARRIREGAEPDLLGEPRNVGPVDAALETIDAFARVAEREGKGSLAGDFRRVAEEIRLRRSAEPAGGADRGPRGSRPDRADEGAPVDAPQAVLEPSEAAAQARGDIDALDGLLPEAERAALAQADRTLDENTMGEALRAAAFCLKEGGSR